MMRTAALVMTISVLAASAAAAETPPTDAEVARRMIRPTLPGAPPPPPKPGTVRPPATLPPAPAVPAAATQGNGAQEAPPPARNDAATTAATGATTSAASRLIRPSLPGQPPAPPKADAITPDWSRRIARPRFGEPAPPAAPPPEVQVAATNPAAPKPPTVPLKRVPIAPPPQVPQHRAPTLPETPPAAPAPGSLVPVPRTYVSDLEELVVEVHLRRTPVLDGTIVLLRGRDVLVPIGELIDTLEIAATVDAAAGVADGWVISEDRRFGINLYRNEFIADGVARTLTPGDVIVYDGTMYIAAGLVERIWPLRASLDGRQGILHLDPSQEFPVEARLQREERYEKLAARQAPTVQELPSLPEARRWLSFPSADLAGEAGLDRGRLVGRHSVLASGDMAKMSLRAFATGDQNKAVSNARLTLEQIDNAGGIFGIDPLRTVLVGDVTTPPIPLVANSRLNRGILLSTAPVDFNSEFSRITIDGEGPAGYDAELYRGGDLIAFQKVGSDGRYVFDDIQLSVGRNVFRIVLFGPQGQRIESTRTVMMSSALIGKGQSATRLSLTQSGRSLFDIVGRSVGSPDQSGGLAATLEHAQGIGETLTLSGFLARVPLQDRITRTEPLEAPITETGVGDLIPDTDDDEDDVLISQEMTEFAGINVAAAALGSFFRVGGVMAGSADYAIEGELVTAIDAWNFNLSHAEFRGFESAVAGQDAQALSSRTRFRVGTTLPPVWVIPRTVLDINAGRERRAGGAETNEASLNFRGRVGPTSVSGFTAVRDTSNRDGPGATDAIASLELNQRIGLSELSLAYVHDLDEGEPQQLLATLADDRFADTRFVLRASHTFGAGGGAAVAAAAFHEFPRFAVGLQARWEEKGGTYVGLGLNTSFGPGPAGPVISRQPLAAAGSAIVRVFHDRDGDGAFGVDDRPVTAARAVIGSGTRTSPTDADGIALISGLATGIPVSVAVDGGSLEDPALQPATKGVSVKPRPGVPLRVDLPVVELGEVEGLVVLPGHDGETPIARATVELVGDNGVTLSARTVFDGVFFLPRVPPGRYTLRLVSGQRFKGKLIDADPVVFTLDRDDLVRFDLLLEIRFAEAERGDDAPS